MSSTAHSRLRLLPAPRSEPPYELGEMPASEPSVAPVQGTLALAFHLRSGVPATPLVGAQLVGRRPRRGTSVEWDARQWAAMLVQAVVEALAGDRPFGQLLRWTTEAVFADLQLESRRRSTARSGPRRDVRRAAVTSVHVFHPNADSAEVCATVRTGGRAEAIALRMEHTGTSWRCTAIAFGPSNPNDAELIRPA